MNAVRLTAFAVLIVVTLVVTFFAARRTSTTTEYLAAGRGISAAQNGFAVAGDLMSAATFLGFTGLIFLSGFDGWVLAIAAAVAFLLVLLLFAERMRNAGQFTVADVLSYRLRARPVRAMTASANLFIVTIYLIAQLVGAGVLIRALTGLAFTPAVIITGAAMLLYVVFGGMLATTWVQIIKAALLMAAGLALAVGVLSQVGWNPISLFDRAAAAHPLGDAYLAPGGSHRTPLNTVAAAVAFVIGTAALPHILIRFFTVPDAKTARASVGWAIGLIGTFFVLTSIIGYGARALLGSAGEKPAGPGANLAAPLLAQHLGGGPDAFGGQVFMAFVGAVAFATILAVVAGLVLSASGSASHDLWSNVIRRGDATEREQKLVARLSSAVIGAIAVAVTLLAGPNFNVAFLVGLALSVAASANFPALVLALSWRGFTTWGALAGIASGLVSSVVLIVLSPAVWPGGAAHAPFPLDYPTLVSIPLGFLGCVVGSKLSRAREDDTKFTELRVRAATGLGAE
ncbi:solute symporter family protein [Amycolatopsis sp. CA-161197]|uniref:solute symporter family protein n=1 Tax=Amycolatopsis sp. CA-161197 TaxID=3239922 RepID=UPI003D8B7E30